MKQVFILIGTGLLMFSTLFSFQSKAASPPTIQTPKTCGEYLDSYSAMESLIPNLTNPNNNKDLGSFPQPQIVKTQGDTYFPADKIQSIWGENITATSYFDKAIDAQVKAATQRIAEQGQKLQNLLPPELRSMVTPAPLSPTADNHLGEVNWATCTIHFSSPTDFIFAGYSELSTQAPSYNKDAITQEIIQKSPGTTINNVEASNKIGDSYYYIDASFSAGKTSIHYFAVSATKSKFTGSVMFYDQAKRSKAEDILRLILDGTNGNNSATPMAPTPIQSTIPQDQKVPIIDSVSTSPTNAALSAGKEFFHDQIGIVTFVDNNLVLVIKGKNLTGASLKTDNIGLNSNSGIEFKGIQVSADGTMVAAQTTIKPTAKEGATQLTLTNSAGKSTTTKIEILITGTQYLQRKFADNSNVKFFGDWPDYMPYQRVLDLEKYVQMGLQAINKNTYNKLGIMTQIYEMNSWNNFQMAKYCPLSFKVIGCASPTSRVIYVSEYTPPPGSDQTVDATILHESAHKLHFYYEGNYAPVPSTTNGFDGEWKAVLGNLGSCSYLPLLNDNSWSDKSRKPSHCGFEWSYGAYQIPSKFYEDVATSTETDRLNPAKLKQNEALGDPRYAKKVNLLDKYGF